MRKVAAPDVDEDMVVRSVHGPEISAKWPALMLTRIWWSAQSIEGIRKVAGPDVGEATMIH